MGTVREQAVCRTPRRAGFLGVTQKQGHSRKGGAGKLFSVI